MSLKSLMTEALKSFGYKAGKRYLVKNATYKNIDIYVNIADDFSTADLEICDEYYDNEVSRKTLYKAITLGLLTDTVVLYEKKKVEAFMVFEFKGGKLTTSFEDKNKISQEKYDEYVKTKNYFPIKNDKDILKVSSNIYDSFSKHIENNLVNLLATFPESSYE